MTDESTNTQETPVFVKVLLSIGVTLAVLSVCIMLAIVITPPDIEDDSLPVQDPFAGTFTSGDADQIISLSTANDTSVSNAGDCGMNLTYSNRAGEREFASAVLFGADDSDCTVAYSVNQFGYYEPWVFARDSNGNITFVGTQGVPVQGIAFQVCEYIDYDFDPDNCVTVERPAVHSGPQQADVTDTIPTPSTAPE